MKTDTLHGGRNLTVLFNNGSRNEITVRQIKLGEYQRAFPLIGDEMKLVAFATVMPQNTPDPSDYVIEEINPEHYEAVRAAVWEVNAKGFFVYAARQRDANRADLKEMPPEVIKALTERITSTLRTPSPTSPPIRG